MPEDKLTSIYTLFRSKHQNAMICKIYCLVCRALNALTLCIASVDIGILISWIGAILGTSVAWISISLTLTCVVITFIQLRTSREMLRIARDQRERAIREERHVIREKQRRIRLERYRMHCSTRKNIKSVK